MTRDHRPHTPSSRRWALQIGLWTLTLTAPAAVLVALLVHPDAALSLLLGAALGALNFITLTLAAVRLLAHAAVDPIAAEASQGRFAPLHAVLRWPAAALATAVFLWYMPGRPAALAAGVFLALLGLVAAAIQLAPRPDPDIDSPPDSPP